MAKVQKGSLNELASQGRVIPTNPNAASRVQSQDNVGGQTSGGMPVNPLPFLAQENANIKTIIGTEGTEPVYYSGRPRDGLLGTYDAVVGNPLKNWFRRTWAKINDPYKVLPSPTEEQTAEIKRRASELATKPYHTFHNYAENAGIEVTQEQGAQVTEDITGLDMETIYETMATRQVAMESEGKVPTGLELAYRTGTQVAWTTAMGFLGAAEWVVRQGASVVKTLDDVADKAAGADDPASIQVVDSVLSYQAELQKKNEALYNLTQRIPIMNKNVLEFAKALYNLTPYEIFKDAGRLIANIDNVKEGQFLKTLNSNLAGSQMVYSMLSDATTNEMYIQRYEEGESPLKLVAELQNPTQELLGGVFLDPTTYIVAPAKLYEDGQRILDKAVKSAADVKVADILKDTRAPEAIKAAVADLQKIAEGTSPKTTQEVLDSINSVVKTVKSEFDAWKNARGFTSFTSTAKQSILLEESKDFFGHMAARAAQLPDGIDRITETVSAMIRLSKGGTEDEIAQAVSALGNSPFGDVVLSPRAMRISHMMSSVSEELPNITKAIDEGDVSKVANIYANQISKFANNSVLSVNEMAEIAQKVKSGIDVTPEMLKVAEEFKALPADVKFFNGLNEIGKKTWMKPMSFLANIYFGINRFAYPTRNVISAIPGMGYEIGFKEAAEVAAKSIAGSQVEKLGVSMLEKTTAEIERLVGFIPGAALRGETPIGQFVDTSKKWLGVIRGGGEVAQLSEQIMSSEIMLKTIKRELRNSLKYGAIPDTVDLIKAGLSPEDAKALVAYTMEHGGDVGKVVDSFRKFMGGAEETFRHIPMSERLQGFLDHVDNGTSVFKELDNALKNAQSVEEWRMAADAAWKKMETLGEFSRTDVVNFSDDIPQSFVQDVKDAQRLRTVAPENIDSFQRVVQATRNARNQFVEVEESMKLFLQSQAPNVPFNQMFGPSIANIRKQADALEQADAVRNLVKTLSDDNTLTPVEMYARLNSLIDPKDIKSYGLSKFTEIDPAKLTPKELKSVMWESYFAWRGQHYADKMNTYVSEMTAVFESMAEAAGMTVAQAAKAANAPLQKAVDAVDDTYKFLVQQKIDVMSFTRRLTPDGTILADVSIDAIKQAGFNSSSHLFNTINKYRKEMGDRPWQTFEQVPMWEVQDAARRMKRELGLVPTDPNQDMLTGAYELMLHPPLANDQPVTQSRMFFDSLDNAKGDFDKYVDDIAARWGETTAPAGALTDEVERALGRWTQTLETRVATAKNEAALVASATRDALLYDYRKTLGNVAAQYISPFHYYHVSASKQWLYNTAADPKWGAIYIDFKENRAQQYAGLPDYWKQNIAVSGLPGIDPKNPLFFNIEASVNPIYQMIGVDYNNPEKRADWFSSTIDSLGKIVPGLYQPLQWVVAAELYASGERDAAAQWWGRLVPQTRIIKTATNALGIDIPLTKYNELDPFVNVFMDGLDPSETKRALLYLSTITEVNGVPVTEEQRIQAANEHTGPIWDEAVRDSLSARALPEAISYFMGVGYKPRTQTDIITEQFYTDYRKLIAARSVMTEDQFTAAWQVLREKSAQNGVSMDVLLIGRKAGEDRDTAFNYNVLSRIPPGQLSDIAEYVGIKPYMIEQFYANKGDMTGWTESDKMRFNAAMLDLSAMLTMPDNATRQEWTTAKAEYKDMQNGLKETFGENILDQINTYFDLTDGEKEDYLKVFPQVEFALQMQTAYVATNPILAPYYNSLNTVNRYETNKMYDQLEAEFGKDITDTVDLYYYLKDEGREDEAKALYQQEGLKAFFKRKIELQQQVNIRVANSVSMLPDNGEFGIRPEFQPQSGIQTDAFNYATGPSQESQIATDVWGQLSTPYQNLIRDYYNGGDLPYSVEKRLDYLARDYGLSKDELLRILGAEVVQ